MGQARQRGDRNQRVQEALGRLPQHQRHIAMVFDESLLALQALEHLMRDQHAPFHDTLRRNVPVLRSQGANFILFFGTEGYTGGTTMGVRTLDELLEEGLPAVFHRLHQKGGHTCAFAVAVDPSIEAQVKRRIAELQPQLDGSGKLAVSPGLEAFEARLRAQRSTPIFGGTTLEPDQVALDAQARQRVTEHFTPAANAWREAGNPAAAAATLTPMAERLPDGSLRLYSASPDAGMVTMDFPAGEWKTYFEQARAMAGEPEWPRLHEPMKALHGGNLIANDAYSTGDSASARALMIECVTEWARFGMSEIQSMRAADREPFAAEVMPNGSLRITTYFPSREMRHVDVPQGGWTALDEATIASERESPPKAKISVRPVLAAPIKGESVPFFVHRDQIESGDTALSLEALSRAAQSLESARAYRNKVFIEVAGYDDDPRALWEVPEVVQYFRRLFTAWPHWLYFMEAERSELLLLLSLLCSREPSSANNVVLFREPEEVELVLSRLQGGLKGLFDRWGLSSDHQEREFVTSVVRDAVEGLLGDTTTASPPH